MKFKRAGIAKRTLKTRHGAIRFRLDKVDSIEHNWTKNLLNILLVRYCNKARYNKLKQKYLSREHAFIHIKVT